MEKEIRVRLYRTEDDNYNELWCTFDKSRKYYARHVYHGLSEWYYVCDPLGYCELDKTVPNDVTFVICDIDGNECLRSSNADSVSFPTLENYCKQKWENIRDTIKHTTENYEADFWAECWDGTTTRKLNQWLLSFKDPELYEQEIKDMYGYDENWLYCRTEQIAMEKIKVFSYLNEEIAIYKITYRHKICGAEWYEYESRYTAQEGVEYPTIICTHGVDFDESKHGDMYSIREAREIVGKVLKEMYPDGTVLYTPTCYSNLWRETVMSYNDAAEYLLQRNFRRSHITEVIENEKQNRTFRSRDYSANEKEFGEIYADYRGRYGI